MRDSPNKRDEVDGAHCTIHFVCDLLPLSCRRIPIPTSRSRRCRGPRRAPTCGFTSCPFPGSTRAGCRSCCRRGWPGARVPPLPPVGTRSAWFQQVPPWVRSVPSPACFSWIISMTAMSCSQFHKNIVFLVITANSAA